MFEHARASGAHVFDGVRVNDIHFSPYDPSLPPSSSPPPPLDDSKTNDGNGKTGTERDYTRLRPTSASYTRKSLSSSGLITFTYLIDASGRHGLLSTRYLRTRRYNQGLKNVASWGYWSGAGRYARGDKRREGSPFFEALGDESGWMWGIPLHDGTMSVGVVQNQEVVGVKRRAMREREEASAGEGGGSAEGKEGGEGEGKETMSANERFYRSQMKLAPELMKLLENATLVSEIHNASDYSYSANPLLSPSVSLSPPTHTLPTPLTLLSFTLPVIVTVNG